jgi:hypothetical protein
MIDMRTLYWGRSWYVRQSPDGLMRGLTHCTPKPEIGDEVIWATSYGEAIGEFTEVKWLRDPDDMYEVTVAIKRRLDREGEAISPEEYAARSRSGT